MIEVKSLTRYYGSRCAVDNVSFSIANNEVVGFLGLNGAGKSTTLKVLAGLLSPSEGTVRIDGVDLTEAPVSFRGRIGFLPDTPPLYREMTVESYLRFVGQLRGMSSDQLDAWLPNVLQKTQLRGWERRVIGELSHGYQQRVGIAQAIVHRPTLVILDEPISGLDPVQIIEMRQVIRGLGQDATVLLSSHNLPEISQTCDRILVMHNGRVVAQGSEHSLASRAHVGLKLDVVVRGDAAVAQATVSAVAGVKAVRPRPSTDDGLVRLDVEMAEDVREEVVKALIAGGLGVRRVDDAVGELEEIFLDLTKERAA